MNQKDYKEIAKIIKFVKNKYKEHISVAQTYEIVKLLADYFEREEKERLGRVTVDKFKHDLEFNRKQFLKGVEE